MKKQFILLFAISLSLSSFAQYSQLQLKDTVKVEYPYKFPILGKLAHEKGFDIPYPAGAMFNFFWAKQNIVIPEIAVGFSEGLLPDIPLTDVSNFIKFENITANAVSVNVRPDLWVLPFLNVYGIFGKTWATTEVNISYPIQMKSVAELEGNSAGFGITGAGGLGKYFFVLDGNWVWTKMTNFEDPVGSKVFSFRIGRAFKIGKNLQSNLAWWAGGMRVNMGGITQGTILLNDVIPPETWAVRDQIVNSYWNWYETEASLPQKKLADQTITPIMNKLAEADGSGIVKYRIRKEPKQHWNMIIGGQYQVDKHHQFRVEGGILGNRKSLLLSYNYRFGI